MQCFLLLMKKNNEINIISSQNIDVVKIERFEWTENESACEDKTTHCTTVDQTVHFLLERDRQLKPTVSFDELYGLNSKQFQIEISVMKQFIRIHLFFSVCQGARLEVTLYGWADSSSWLFPTDILTISNSNLSFWDLYCLLQVQMSVNDYFWVV